MTTDVIATNSAAITLLVATVTGKPLTNKAAKVTKGITYVLTEATDTLASINKAITTAKSKMPTEKVTTMPLVADLNQPAYVRSVA